MQQVAAIGYDLESIGAAEVIRLAFHRFGPDVIVMMIELMGRGFAPIAVVLSFIAGDRTLGRARRIYS
jgi:hypothetical protein